jgi:hypothetical protein
MEMRRTYDSDGVPLNRALARVYTAVGLPEQARAAENRASASEALAHRA